MPNADLRALFNSLQAEMSARLALGSGLQHPTTKGNVAEAAWLELLRNYLPRRYEASAGQVIDSKGACSQAIDVIVYDRQYSPFLLKKEGVTFVPAESVYAALEVKQSLTAENLRYAAEKAASVRALTRTSAPVTHLGGITQGRSPPAILGGILATTSSWSPAFGPAFARALHELPQLGILDLGCALDAGTFEQNNNLNVHEGSAALLRFFLAFLRRLQSLGTAPAMDISAYERCLD